MRTSYLATILAFVLSTVYPHSVVAASPPFKVSPNSFGIIRQIPRGGAVHELSTWEDVEALLIRASGEGKLVVMDFSATWVRANLC